MVGPVGKDCEGVDKQYHVGGNSAVFSIIIIVSLFPAISATRRGRRQIREGGGWLVKPVGKDCDGVEKQKQTINCNKKKYGDRTHRGEGLVWLIKLVQLGIVSEEVLLAGTETTGGEERRVTI